MRTVSTALKAHMQGQATTLATCWKVVRTDGTVYGFTDCSENLFIDGVLYEAKTGHTPTALASTSQLSVSNSEAAGTISSDSITDADLLAGRWDMASVTMFLVNYADLAMGAMALASGVMGEVTMGRTTFSAELRSLTQQLQQSIGNLFTPGCTAEFGDSRCTINIANFTQTATVASVSSLSVFTSPAVAEGLNYWQAGIIKWTSGANIGNSARIKTSALNGQITLIVDSPAVITVGDTFSISKGCDKSIQTCQGTYQNIINFRGFPNLPGRDKLTGGSTS